MTANEIAKIINDNKDKYEYFGLRGMTKNPITHKYEIAIVGESISNSYSWDDGDTTDCELCGTSALNVDCNNIAAALNAVKSYDHRSQIVLLGSNCCQFGDDAGEIVMYDNLTVLAII
jgi:hypothetical protein